jgi:hypothetical protein
MRREAMKLLFAIVPWILLAASIFSFASGWEWKRSGELNHEVAGHDAAFYDLGDSFLAVGFSLQCVGVVGTLIALGLFGARSQFKAYLKRIRILEEELNRREQIALQEIARDRFKT